MIMNLINTCIRETSNVSDSLRLNDLNLIGILQKQLSIPEIRIHQKLMFNKYIRNLCKNRSEIERTFKDISMS